MNTAVPGTRVGGSAARSASNSLSGTVFSIMRLERISRPRFQVLITKYSATAIASGTQPPCQIFKALETRNVRSTIRNTPATLAALRMLQPQTSRLIT